MNDISTTLSRQEQVQNMTSYVQAWRFDLSRYVSSHHILVTLHNTEAVSQGSSMKLKAGPLRETSLGGGI